MAQFVKHAPCPKCGSNDNLAVYDDDSFYCFSAGCGNKSISQDYKELIEENFPKKKRGEKLELKVDTKPIIDPDDAAEIKATTSVKAKGFRDVKDETYAYFGVRHGFDESTGEVNEQYYPCTQEGELTGYKIREVPKNFRSIGRTGATCELFGQFRFKRGGRYVIITEGELDALSAYEMLKDYNKSKGWDFETAVVSPTTGAQSKKQIAAQYKFFDSFENIIISYDNDEAGQAEIDKLIAVLPKGKVKVMKMRLKDANEYLKAGKQKEFISDFYNAEKRVPVGVLPSGGLYDRIIQQTEVPKVPFPPFMRKLNDMFIGGMPLGYIFNIAADTGVGKTTYVNEMVYHWIFNSPHMIGIVSMELDAGQYGEVLLSRHISRKLALMPDIQEKIAFLKSDKVKEQANELTKHPDGSDRFYLLDNRDGTVEEIQETIEELVVSCGCKVIILDPLQDILDGLSNEEQATFMKWMKGFIKSHGVTFVLINHMRKSEKSGEQDIMGSSTIIKSAAANIILRRNKLAEDPIERNTTNAEVAKNRVCGITGPAGGAYYDNQTHTMHDLDEWLKENGPDEF